MTALEWHTVGTRFFEAGVDRGVLYIAGLAGVPWNGLTGVDETPSGGNVTSYFVDGIKYQNATSREDYEATITAYTYPEEFDACIGIVAIGTGLYATHQKKKSFGFSYRTRVGNDLAGTDHGYKIHVVYNATAETSTSSHKTMGSNAEAEEFSWHVFTKPPLPSTFTPTAHFVIDSRTTSPALLSTLEDILYGTDTDDPRLPSIEEMLFIFSDYVDQSFDAGFLSQPYITTYDAGVVGRITPDVSLDGGEI